MIWHTLDTKTVLNELNSSEHGLSESAVLVAQQTHGKNELNNVKKVSAFTILLHQFTDFMIIILIVAAVISGLAGDLVDTVIIVVIVALNALLGFVQEYRAEKTMEALRNMSTPVSKVKRDGKTIELSSTEIVPGDIVLLEAGQLVPADLRILEAHSLQIEEATLTGESVPASKTSNLNATTDLPLGDRNNMAYKATKIINGRGYGVAVATGMRTEIGKIAGMLQTKEMKTPLQVRMADFSKKLSWIILGICVLMFVLGIMRGEAPLPMLLVAITLAVAAIPEALPALITIALARGAKRLATKNVVVRKLPAVETLGSVTYICSDKTGTLTRNEMKVTETVEADLIDTLTEPYTMLEIGMALNHDLILNEDNKWIGDPTEIALADYITTKFDITTVKEIQKKYPRIAELPFDADRKRMTTIHGFGKKYLVITKGASESVLSVVDTDQTTSESKAAHMAQNGLRVICFGYKIIDTKPTAPSIDNIETNLTYAGLAGMIDPPRDEVKQAIEEAKSAGITPVMITGDHLATASSIARQIGILTTDKIAISGTELAALSAQQLAEKIETISVYARVTPQQKLDIVKALQKRNHFVAMTGDGANDAPSLKTANIGIAMGITGTDVSKEAAHLILLDDNFATIIKAVKEGRRIFDNIRRFVKYIMACNSAEILLIVIAPFLGMPIPLLPIHILWINLVTDGLPGLALANEKAEPNIMKRKPRPPGESMFADGIGMHIIWVGILMAGITLAVQKYALTESGTHWQTMVFTVLLVSQLGHVLAIRSDKYFIFEKGFFSNPLLLGAVAATFMLQLAIIYLPFANKIFKTQPLTINELSLCILLSAVVFHSVELEKFIKRKLM
jgi:Ca2+-transporting ATPase